MSSHEQDFQNGEECDHSGCKPVVLHHHEHHDSEHLDHSPASKKSPEKNSKHHGSFTFEHPSFNYLAPHTLATVIVLGVITVLSIITIIAAPKEVRIVFLEHLHLRQPASEVTPLATTTLEVQDPVSTEPILSERDKYVAWLEKKEQERQAAARATALQETEEGPSEDGDAFDDGPLLTKSVDLSGITWKRYIHALSGISVEYPSTWEIEESGPNLIDFEGVVTLSTDFNSPTLREELVLINETIWELSGTLRAEVIESETLTPGITLERWDYLLGDNLKLGSSECPKGGPVDKWLAEIQGRDSIVILANAKSICLPAGERSEREAIMKHMANSLTVTHEAIDPTIDPRLQSTLKKADLNGMVAEIIFYYDAADVCPGKKSQIKDESYEFYDEFVYSTSPDRTRCHLGIPVLESEKDLGEDMDFDSAVSGWTDGFSGSDTHGCAPGAPGACYDFVFPL